VEKLHNALIASQLIQLFQSVNTTPTSTLLPALNLQYCNCTFLY